MPGLEAAPQLQRDRKLRDSLLLVPHLRKRLQQELESPGELEMQRALVAARQRTASRLGEQERPQENAGDNRGSETPERGSDCPTPEREPVDDRWPPVDPGAIHPDSRPGAAVTAMCHAQTRLSDEQGNVLGASKSAQCVRARVKKLEEFATATATKGPVFARIANIAKGGWLVYCVQSNRNVHAVVFWSLSILYVPPPAPTSLSSRNALSSGSGPSNKRCSSTSAASCAPRPHGGHDGKAQPARHHID